MPRLLEQYTSVLLQPRLWILIQNKSPKGTFHTSKEAPQLELRGNVPALSKAVHFPQACENES